MFLLWKVRLRLVCKPLVSTNFNHGGFRLLQQWNQGTFQAHRTQSVVTRDEAKVRACVHLLHSFVSHRHLLGCEAYIASGGDPLSIKLCHKKEGGKDISLLFLLSSRLITTGLKIQSIWVLNMKVHNKHS